MNKSANQLYFLDMIKHLRQQEAVLLYARVLTTDNSESNLVIDFLRTEYQREALSYPFNAPEFDADAALWSAKLIYHAAQLMLYREQEASNATALLDDYKGKMNASAILSSDLCLRFLPDLLIHFKLINQEDELIPLLETILTRWHYSGVNYDLNIEQLDFNPILSHPSLQQLYVDRVITYKKLYLAHTPQLKPFVTASLGLFAQDFWNKFNPNIHV